MPIKTSQHTTSMIQPGYAAQKKATPSHKPQGLGNSPAGSSSPSSGSGHSKKGNGVSLPAMRIRKIRKKSAGQRGQGAGGVSSRRSGRGGSSYENLGHPSQYGRPASTLKNSASHQNLGAVRAAPLGKSPLAALKSGRSRSSTNMNFYQDNAAVNRRTRSNMSHHQLSVAPGSPAQNEKALHPATGRQGTGQNISPGRQTNDPNRKTHLTFRSMGQRPHESSNEEDDDDMYTTVRALDQFSRADASVNSHPEVQHLDRSAFNVRVSQPAQEMNKWLARQTKKMAQVLGGDVKETERIKKTDTASLLTQAAQDLKMMNYKLSRCVT